MNMRICEIFTSIQGEGKWVGIPQVFVRLSGCNLRCRWCDTPSALEYESGKEMSVSEVVEQVEREGKELKSVCITGGEPLLQLEEVKELVKQLRLKGYSILLETNGTIGDKKLFSEVECVSMDIKTPSSGEKSDLTLLSLLSTKDQVKLVIEDEKDYTYAKKILKKIVPEIEIIFQPQGIERAQWLARKVLEDKLQVRVLPQLHKILGMR